VGRIVNLFNGIVMAQQAQRQLLVADREYSALEVKIKSLEAANLKLQAEMNPIERRLKECEETVRRLTQPKEKYETVLGCMKFEADPALYCPGCYANKKLKVPTSRKNSRLRFCAACKTEIPSG
jgi:hypothetical protein